MAANESYRAATMHEYVVQQKGSVSQASSAMAVGSEGDRLLTVTGQFPVITKQSKREQRTM